MKRRIMQIELHVDLDGPFALFFYFNREKPKMYCRLPDSNLASKLEFIRRVHRAQEALLKKGNSEYHHQN